jgi:hypothetical protein
MSRYLLAIQQPDGPPPSDLDLDAVMRDVNSLLDEMKEAGAWVFNGGLHPPHAATVVQVRDGEVLLTDGPYAEGKEHIGGLTVIAADDLAEALAWARRLAEVLKPLPIEVRPFHDEPEG